MHIMSKISNNSSNIVTSAAVASCATMRMRNNFVSKRDKLRSSLVKVKTAQNVNNFVNFFLNFSERLALG